MKCSKLNHDLSVNDIIENDLFNCGNIETAFHFFLECPLYRIFRNDLQLETMFLPNLSLNIILNGDVDSSAQRNIGIHSAILKYIIKTNRFKRNCQYSLKYHQSKYLSK